MPYIYPYFIIAPTDAFYTYLKEKNKKREHLLSVLLLTTATKSLIKRDGCLYLVEFI